MYFANLLIDTGVHVLTRLFDPSAYDADGIKSTSVENVAGFSSSFPAEPVFWGDDMPTASRRYLRGMGAVSLLRGGGSALLINLNPNSPYPSFIERGYLSGVEKVFPQPGSVVDNLKGRSFWGNIEDNIYAPHIGNGKAADYSKFVLEGQHAEGAMARVLAFALEHALAPFDTRLRIRNAAACYWCLGRYRSDNITFSIQNAQGAFAWSSPSSVGETNEPSAAVWVGAADKTYGMALLSRIYDEGGPVFNQRAYILSQFDQGRLLMVGTGSLQRELPNVQSSDFWRAIREAIWLLQSHNNVTQGFVEKTLHLLIHNLPIYDSGMARERDLLFWDVRNQIMADVDITPAAQLRVDAALSTSLGADAGALLFGSDTNARNPHLLTGITSNILRNVVLAPDAVNGNDWAPGFTVSITDVVANMLAVQQVALPVAIRGEVAYSSFLDPDGLPNIQPYNRPLARDISPAWSSLSGRAAYRIFGYAPPPAADGLHRVFADWVAVPAPDVVTLGLDTLTPGANDGRWLEWSRAYAPGVNQPDNFNRAWRQYAIRSFLPVSREQYPAHFIPPPAGELRNFDCAGVMSVGLTNAGALPDITVNMPRISGYLNEIDPDRTPLIFLTEDGLRGLPNAVNANQRNLLVTRGFAVAWEAAHLRNTQHDAFRRWAASDRAAEKLTVPADEHLLYMGGCRGHKFVEPAGGLWALCFLMKQESIKAVCLADTVISFLQDSSQLASFCLKLRCGVEITDQLLRISNSRISSCRMPFAYDESLFDRMERGDAADPAIHTPSQYLAQQGLTLASLFNNPHGTCLNEFGISVAGGMRLREPKLGGGITLDELQRMNWVATQVLPNSMWVQYLGVSPPTFKMDRVGRRMFTNAKFTTQWNKLGSDIRAGAMLDVQDEAWMASLSTIFGDDFDVLTLSLPAYGQDLEVYIGEIRERHSNQLSPLIARLFLPHETRIRRIGVFGAANAKLKRPKFDDGDVWRADGDNVITLDFAYNADGFSIVGSPHGGVADDVGVIDVRSTIFASDGISLTRFNSTAIDPTYPDAHRVSGHYWLASLPAPIGVAPSFTPAFAALIGALQAPPMLPSTGHDEGPPIMFANEGKNVQSNPNTVVTPDQNIFGDQVVHESQSITLHELTSKLQGLDPEVQRLLTLAFMRQTFGTDDSSVNSGLTGSTDAMTFQSRNSGSNPGVRSVTQQSLGGSSLNRGVSSNDADNDNNNNNNNNKKLDKTD